VAGVVLAPEVFYVAFEFGAEVSVGDVACEASVDLVAGPVVASAFGDGVDGVLGVHFWFIGGVGGVYKSGVVVTGRWS